MGGGRGNERNTRRWRICGRGAPTGPLPRRMVSRIGPQRKTRRRSPHPAERVPVVSAILAAGSEKAAAHRLGLSHSTVKHHLANARSKVGATTTAQLVWILDPRLPEPEGGAAAGGGPAVHVTQRRPPRRY